MTSTLVAIECSGVGLGALLLRQRRPQRHRETLKGHSGPNRSNLRCGGAGSVSNLRSSGARGHLNEVP